MRDAAIILKELGYNEAIVNGYRNEIWIEWAHANLVLHYAKDDDLGCGYYGLDEVDLHRLVIDDVCLAGGCGAGAEEYHNNDISFSATMYRIVRQIQNTFPNAIDYFFVGDCELDDCDIWGCPENVEYGYRIYLKREFWADSSRLNDLLKSVNNEAVPFCDCYKDYIGIHLSDNYKFSFLGTNTKVRRLGYLTLLLTLFEDSPRIAKKNLLRMLEQKAVDSREAINSYKNQKGIIVPSKSGISANPYIKLALEIGVIREMTGHYELGKMGRVFLETRKRTLSYQSNSFALTLFEKVFWLERLLEQDFLYIYTLIEYAFVCKVPLYSDLRKRFDTLIINKLEAISREIKDSMGRAAIRIAIQRIKGWKKSEVYLEHILMPRINWLYDLDLLELKEDLSFELTQEGRLLFIHLAQWGDLGQSAICNAASYLETFYMHIANDVFMEGQGVCTVDMLSPLTDALLYSFDHFKTMAPNRVTFSVFAAFAKYTLFHNKQLVVETSSIKDNYLPSMADKYVFMYQRYYNDGFIQRK